MKKHIIYPIIVVATLLLYLSCRIESEDCHFSIKIANNSDNDIYVYAYTGYPDTFTIKYDNNPVNDDMYWVDSNSYNYKALRMRDCWEDMVEDFSEEGVVMVFVFDADTLEKYTWEYITENYKILKRYDLSLQDLKDRNWRITYPDVP
jgi:hypothetical protein